MQIQSHLKPKAYVADRFGRPRYCATIWIDFLNAHLSSGTLDRYVNAVASIYRSAERMCPPVDLDRALLEPNLDDVEAVLTSYLLVQQSSGNLRHWQLALRFVTAILEYVVGIDDPARVQRMRIIRQRFQQLSVRPRQPGPRIRSLPLSVMESLYEVFHPLSYSNIAVRDFDQAVNDGLIGVALCHKTDPPHNSGFAKWCRNMIAGRVPSS